MSTAPLPSRRPGAAFGRTLASCAIGLALVATGCSSSPNSSPPTSASSTPSVASTMSTPSSIPSPTDAGASPSAGLSAPSGLGDPVATRTTTITAASGSFTVALDVYPVRRQGKLATLNARLRVLKTPPIPADGVLVAPASLLGVDSNNFLQDSNAEGLNLIDTAARLRYQPAVDASGAALCSPEIPSSWRAGDVIHVACVYGAPASSTVTVSASTFGSIADVPVE